MADARRLAVERAGQADAGALRLAPGDEAVEFHRPSRSHLGGDRVIKDRGTAQIAGSQRHIRSEEHTSELQSLMRISYAVFCLKKKITYIKTPNANTRS